MMYRIRPGCAAYARMNIPADQARRMMYIGDGLYRVDFSNPATEFVDCEDWDGEGYRITRPYAEKTRRRQDGAIEFRHSLSDIFNGLLAVGLSIQHVQESPQYQRQSSQTQPGSWEHWLTYVTGFAIVAKFINYLG